MAQPDKFGGDGESCAEFENDFRGYVAWEEMSDDDAILMLHFCSIREARSYLGTLKRNDAQSINKVFKRLKERFFPTSFQLTIHERLCLDKQRPSESVDEYIARFTKMMLMLDLSKSQMNAMFTSNRCS